ncbi:MAG: 30S ribosomal protein S2 [Gammaproteobacteria bacterium RIFCSPHIGHO2_12_FULL_36_30]|nr:MAG: 30S ribosomal protein S2 [Gammaproteobacteria bacterium RIFCSPHIGHO2_12_FULL_36_30]
MAIAISMRQMLEAGVHFGHQKRFWNPKMAPFIYGEREKTHIINLEHTLPRFRQLLETIAQITSKRGKVLFVGTKHAARDIVKEEATRCAMPYVDNRWLGGMLTNYKTIRQSIKRLKELEAILQNPKALIGKTKKEVLTIQRDKDKLAANLDGIKNMGGLPDMLFVIDVKQEKTAIQEARRLGIAVAAIVDTNASPDEVDFVVPGNDDAMRAIRFYCQTVADVIIESRRGIVEEEAARAKEKAERSKSKAQAKPAEVKTAKKITKKKADDVSATTEVVVEEIIVEVDATKEVVSKKKSVSKANK